MFIETMAPSPSPSVLLEQEHATASPLLSLSASVESLFSLLRPSNSDDNNTNKKKNKQQNIQNEKRKVAFNDLEIRVYPNTLGDNPECRFGPPISIDWDPIGATTISLDNYEAQRSPRRSFSQMIMPSYVRKKILRDQWGIPAEELVEAAKEARRTRKARRWTARFAFLSPFEEYWENARERFQKSVKKIVTFFTMRSASKIDGVSSNINGTLSCPSQLDTWGFLDIWGFDLLRGNDCHPITD